MVVRRAVALARVHPPDSIGESTPDHQPTFVVRRGSDAMPASLTTGQAKCSAKVLRTPSHCLLRQVGSDLGHRLGDTFDSPKVRGEPWRCAEE